MNLQIFSHLDFPKAIQTFFERLSIPVNYVDFHPTTGKEILVDTYKDNESFQLMKDVYFMGMVDDDAFAGNTSKILNEIQSDYDGILVFGVTLHERENGLLPTRSQLSEITRAFNREFYYTPVVVIFKYDHHIAFANTERLKYTQEWREGEKAGKVSLLRDIDIDNPHSGHERILKELKIPTSGTKKVDSFAKLYEYWQEVLNVNLLNKKFYQELSDWYFWARKEVRFPNEPLRVDFESDEKFEQALDEHNGKNLIRLLTRILFVWFLKEKQLVPSELFNEEYISSNLLEDFEPQKPHGVFATGKHTSKYYRAILQNLFFATLNCEKGKREFRKPGSHQNTTSLMRYSSYFKDPTSFYKLMESNVPFMNGGLFDCLDKPHPTKKGRHGGDIIVYRDGFSDRPDNILNVPDYLFFDKNEKVDLSKAYGAKKYKNVNTRGLIKILESYKFTITENTPIEEDIALDPELLGRVFENLLASYNPETKTTARKQTGSFYTPREIVNYMVDESLIAYLKTAIEDWGNLDAETLDEELHVLTSFDTKVPFEDNLVLQKEIITALSSCTILDPACGSGAFPMGILQKMVYILQKLDPENKIWKEVQLEKAEQASKAAFEIEDKKAREERLIEINDAFDENVNDADYARKLFLIENCIYGVDIQPIATQISKLRFFISLVVDQKVNPEKDNFGIRPLPNLETKFVAGNTLIGIEKGGGFFETEEVNELEAELKLVRHKVFSLKSPERKKIWRKKDKNLREELANILEKQGLPLDTAEKLSKWDPYDQNESAPFFDPEWMFGIKNGFDVVIGNPPYIQLKWVSDSEIYSNFVSYLRSGDIYSLFYERCTELLIKKGVGCFITSNKWLKAEYGKPLRNYLIRNSHPIILIDFGGYKVFESATVDTNILLWSKGRSENDKVTAVEIKEDFSQRVDLYQYIKNMSLTTNFNLDEQWLILNSSERRIKKLVEIHKPIKKLNIKLFYGILTGANPVFIIDKEERDYLVEQDIKNSEIIMPILRGQDLIKYGHHEPVKYLINSYSKVDKIGLSSVRIDIDYPSLLKYFKSFGEKFKHRGEQGEYWFNLRSCSYILEFKEPKIIYADIVQDGGKFYFDTEGYYTNDTAFIIRGQNLRYLTIILNSIITDYLYRKFYSGGGLGGRGLRFKKEFLERLPVPIMPNFEQLFLNFHDILNFTAHDVKMQTFKNISDALVLDLYFSEHVRELGLQVLELINKDINKFLKKEYFKEMSDEEKEKVVVQLHDTWTNPNNEVVKRMAQFKEKSPEILKPILES